MSLRERMNAKLAAAVQSKNNARRVMDLARTELRAGHPVSASMLEHLWASSAALKEEIEIASANPCQDCQRRERARIADEVFGLMLDVCVAGDQVYGAVVATQRRNARDLVSILRAGQAAPMMFRRAS